MLIRLIQSGFSPTLLISFLLAIPCIIFSLSAHECAHAFVAYKLGDDTARLMGRMTLNPMKHLDPIGTVLLLIAGFGYARPVPVNPLRFKNSRRGMALTALAGPVTNFIIAFFFTIIYAVFIKVFPFNAISTDTGVFWFMIISYLLSYMVALNITLGVFNFIPIPPLDGSKILQLIIPDRAYEKIRPYERYISIVFIVLLVSGVLSVPINAVSSFIESGFRWFVYLILPFLR